MTSANTMTSSLINVSQDLLTFHSSTLIYVPGEIKLGLDFMKEMLAFLILFFQLEFLN